MFDKHFVGLDLTGFQNNGLQRPVSRVTLLLDDQNAVTAGDDTGTELTADCPHATQAMVNAILAQVRGYQYQMFSAEAANLDPAAELGDGGTAGGVYSVLARISEDGSGYADIAAPGEEELEDDFPTSGPMTKVFNRKIAKTRSQIIKTAEAIIQRIEDTASGLTTEFSVRLDSISGTVQGLNGEISSVRQYANEISSRVTDLNGTVTVTLNTLNGLTVTDASGTTRIKGSSIDTATLRANSISADKLNLTGAITFADLNSSTQSTINAASSNASAALTNASAAFSAANAAQNTVNGWVYPGTTEINGAMIRTGTVEASILRGGMVDLRAYNGLSAGTISIEKSQFYSSGIVKFSAEEMQIASTDVSLLLRGSEAYINIGTIGVDVHATDFSPAYDSSCTLGWSRRSWPDLYLMNDPIVTSDQNKKTNISYNLEPYETIFNFLRPASFQLVNGQSGRTHLGLISQDVEQALADSGLTDMDFAGFIKSPRKDDEGNILEGKYDYALRYGEFIALLIWQMQKLKAEVAELKGRIAE